LLAEFKQMSPGLNQDQIVEAGLVALRERMESRLKADADLRYAQETSVRLSVDAEGTWLEVRDASGNQLGRELKVRSDSPGPGMVEMFGSNRQVS
jgi:hypothetical protein